MCACVIRALCLRTLNCHDKLQKHCHSIKEPAGPCQRQIQSCKAVCRHWGCLLASVPILSLAGRPVHPTNQSQVLFLGVPCFFWGGVGNDYSFQSPVLSCMPSYQ